MDFDLWLKLAKGFSIEKIDTIVAAEHAHKDAKTQRDIGQMYAVQCFIQIRHGYEQVAMQDITRWMNDYLELRGKVDRIYRFPLARRITSLAQIVLGRLR